MNKRDRHGFGIGMDLTPAHEDLASVGLIEAGENFDQRRLAGAVLTDKGVDFARHDRQVDAIQRERAEKALRQTPDLDRGTRICRHGSSLGCPIFASTERAASAMEAKLPEGRLAVMRQAFTLS